MLTIPFRPRLRRNVLMYYTFMALTNYLYTLSVYVPTDYLMTRNSDPLPKDGEQGDDYCCTVVIL